MNRRPVRAASQPPTRFVTMPRFVEREEERDWNGVYPSWLKAGAPECAAPSVSVNAIRGGHDDVVADADVAAVTL